MTLDEIRIQYLACAKKWMRQLNFRIAASYIAVLGIDGIENWTPAERENKRIELMNALKDKS